MSRNRLVVYFAVCAIALLVIDIGQGGALGATGGLTGNITEINAYAVGNPAGIQGFAGYTFPNLTSNMPQSLIAVIHSPGNSTVTIYVGATPIIVNKPFNWTLRYYFNAPVGVSPLNFTVSSQLLGKTRQITYLVDIMTVTQYIQYLNQHSQQGFFITSGSLYSIIGTAMAVILASALSSIPLADGLRKRHQRKKGIYEEV